MSIHRPWSALDCAVGVILTVGLPAGGCAGTRVVRFEEPRGATVWFSDPEEEPREIPFEERIETEIAYRLRVVLPEPVLGAALGIGPGREFGSEPVSLRGVLVCPSGGEDAAEFRMPFDGIRMALRGGTAAYARAWDRDGRLVLLFKASVAGIDVADLEMATHVGRAARNTRRTAWEVGRGIALVTLSAAPVAAHLAVPILHVAGERTPSWLTSASRGEPWR